VCTKFKGFAKRAQPFRNDTAGYKFQKKLAGLLNFHAMRAEWEDHSGAILPDVIKTWIGLMGNL
jgi:hypothetical protein